MEAIVLFDTIFGNTERIAGRLVAGLQKTGIRAESANIKAANVAELARYDLLALGAPTQYFTASKPLKKFLEQLKDLDLKGKHGFAFDTKLDSRLSGSAAKFIEKKLAELGVDIILPHASAIVMSEKKKTDRVGEAILREGMEDLFESIGKEIGTFLKTIEAGAA